VIQSHKSAMGLWLAAVSLPALPTG